MARIPDSDSLPKPSLDGLRGRPDALAQAASGGAFGAGVFGAAAGFGQAVSDVANAERKRRARTASITGRDPFSAIDAEEPAGDAASFGNAGLSDDAAFDDAGAALRRNRNAALNELAVSLPHDFDLAIEDARGTMPPGGRGFTDAASKSIEAVRKDRLSAALGKYALPKSDAADLDQRTQAFAALARDRARTFERRESERQFHLDTGRQVETLRRHVSEDPAKLPFVAAQVDGLYDNASEHLTPDQIAQDRASAQRAVHRAALDTQVERAPETVLNNLARDALGPLVRQGALDAADLTLARQRARRAVKRRAQLEGASKRKAFADFRANLEVAARRGEVGQKFIDRQHELGAITLSERNRYVGIAKRVRERREEAAAQRRELDALKAGGGTVGAAVLRGIRTNLDGLIAAGARDPELVRFALEAGAITKEGARERLERMRAGEANIAERETLIERGRRADKEPLDPTNPQDRKAAELHYRRDVGPRIERLSGNAKTAKQGVREGAAFVKTTGIMPAAYSGQITRALASENPGIQAVGALHLHETLKRNPDAVPFVVGDKDTVFAVHAATLQEAGFEGPAAVKQAAAAKEATPQQQAERLKAYDSERVKHEQDNLAFARENGVPAEQVPKLNENVRRIYGTTGNLDASRQTALALAKREAAAQKGVERQSEVMSGGQGSNRISGSSGDDSVRDGAPDEELGIGDGDKRNRAETFDAFKKWFLDGQLPEQTTAPDGFPARHKFGRRTLDTTTLEFLRRAANATNQNVEQVIRGIFDSKQLQLRQKGRLASIARIMAGGAVESESDTKKFQRLSKALTASHLQNLDAENADIERRTRETFRRLGDFALQGRGRPGRLGARKGGQGPDRRPGPARRSDFVSDRDWQDYVARVKSGVPLGFRSKASVTTLTSSINRSLERSGYRNVLIGMRGSSVTRWSWNNRTKKYDYEKQFRPTSDYDLTLVDRRLLKDVLKAGEIKNKDGKIVGNLFQGRKKTRSRPLTAEDFDKLAKKLNRPELKRIADILRRGINRRDASIVIHETKEALQRRGAFMWLP